MPGHRHGKSIKWPKVYEALKRRGYSKTKAAKISNAMAQRRRTGRRASKGRRTMRR
jgi:hypothetical protein